MTSQPDEAILKVVLIRGYTHFKAGARYLVLHLVLVSSGKIGA
jgi:hypothetical protein